MYQIDNGTSAASLPAPAAAGTPGFFRQGGAGLVGTQVDADWLNAVQGELLALIAASGILAQKSSGGVLTVNQALQSVRRLAAANVRTITATGALTADDAGVVYIDATAGAVVVTLPAANAANGIALRYHLVRKDASANSVTISRAGSDTFQPGSQTSFTIGAEETVILVGDGSASWYPARTQDGPWTIIGSGSGSITMPAGYTGLEVELIGAGGGAAGCDGTNAGGGGGAGATARKDLRGAVPGTVFTYAIGAGGTGGTGGANGTDGASSTLSGTGISLTAGGGRLGSFGTSPAGGDGGTATGGDENIPGGAGGDGYPSGKFTGGNGGASSQGGGGRAATSTSSTLQNGHAPGSGAGAGYLNNVNGGTGASGRLKYRWRA